MRLKDLFTVPTGKKVTEKHLYRVLISSICSILLCMSCLVGTTWAWFAVSIENTGNEIQIGRPEVILTVDNVSDTSAEIPAGSYPVQIEHANEQDDLDKKSTLYTTLTFQWGNETLSAYTTLNEGNGYKTEITIVAEKAFTFGWEVSWFPPAGAEELTGGIVTLTAGTPAEQSTEAAAEPLAGDEAGPAEGTPAGETTEPSAQPETDPTETSTEQTDPAAEPEEEPGAAPADPPNSETTAPNTESTEPTAAASAEGVADAAEDADGTEAVS